MAKASYAKGKKVIIMTPDYDKLGRHYATTWKNQKFNEHGPSHFPDRQITKAELVDAESKKGLREPYYWAHSKKPKPAYLKGIKTVPGELVLSRGRIDCSCNNCFTGSSRGGLERDYSVLWKPEGLEKYTKKQLRQIMDYVWGTRPIMHISTR